MLTKIKALYARVKTELAHARSTVAVVAGIAAEAVATGTIHGTALWIAQAILAVATAVGVHVTTKTTVKAGMQAAGDAAKAALAEFIATQKAAKTQTQARPRKTK